MKAKTAELATSSEIGKGRKQAIVSIVERLSKKDAKGIVTDIYTHVNAVKEHYAKIGLDEDEFKKIIC